MRGHEALKAMRRRGVRPVIAVLSDGMDDAKCWRDWQDLSPIAHVEIEPADSLQRLDLRFLVGMVVWVSSMDEGRLATLFALCIAAGAKSVDAALIGYCGDELVRTGGFMKMEAA